MKLGDVVETVNAALPKGSPRVKLRTWQRWAHRYRGRLGAYQIPPGKGGIWYVRDEEVAADTLRRILTGETEGT